MLKMIKYHKRTKNIATIFFPAFFVFLLIILGVYFAFNDISKTIDDELSNSKVSEIERHVFDDFLSLPLHAAEKTEQGYAIKDNNQNGPKIQYSEENKKENSGEEEAVVGDFKILFNKDYSQGIDINIGSERQLLLTDNNNNFEKLDVLISEETNDPSQDITNLENNKNSFWDTLLSRVISKNKDGLEKFIKYEDKSGRKKMYYAYQKDGGTGEKKLKNWVLYEYGNGEEEESYTISDAKLKKNNDGEIEVYYWGEQEKQNDLAMAEVDDNLLARAQKFLEKEFGPGASLDNKNPDFIIPRPFYIDKNFKRVELDWELSEEESTFHINFQVPIENYPIALDPTLIFSAPGINTSSSLFTGEAANNSFGGSLSAGDFNNDGKIDLAVGAHGYNLYTGRVYIFYNDGTYSTAAASADVIITGESTGDQFGISLSSGDFNNDGKTDLAVGTYVYNTYTGRVYIFYSDGAYPTTASSADAIITGEATNSGFGISLSAGDFNNDGKTDLAVGAHFYNTSTGRTYIFYNDGAYPTAAASADVIITGEGGLNSFGFSLSAGDFNNDGKTDLAVGAYGYNSYTGRTYIFYNDGTYSTTAASADVIITGETTSNFFGYSLSSGDFNNDGKADLAVGASGYNTSTGRVYIFYNDGTYPTAAASADVIISGEVTNNLFGTSLAASDFNNDGKTDLAIGAIGYNSNTGRAYIFYNDGTYPSAAASADVIITGEVANNNFGVSLSAGDFNNDGKTDLAVGASRYNSYTGRVYVFYNQNGVMNTNNNIEGEAMNNYFGHTLSAGDFNNDGKTDLVVGASPYNSSTGRVYIFYNDGAYPEAAASADVIITGQAINNNFGISLSAGDFNNDGKTDLAVGANGYTSYTGRTYIFYNDGAYPTAAASADVIITGQGTTNYFGHSLSAGDFNNDGKTDLAVGAYSYTSSTGRTYIFYNDGTYPTAAASADVIITGEATWGYFGISLSAGDFNNDGKTDLAVGASRYNNTNTGRVYIFYNDGVYPEAAASADFIITGEAVSNYFGQTLSAGDFNNDGKTDLAVGANSYNTSTGRVFIFYNDGTYPATAASADVIITGEATSNAFGISLSAGDFNNDGKTDLAVGASSYNSSTGRVYIFYNDGSYPEAATSADVIITGQATASYFGSSLSAGDFNNDGKTDLAVGAYGYNGNIGRVYFYEGSDAYVWNLQPQVNTPRVLPGVGQELKITGETTSDYFGWSLAVGDFNNDGKTDLAVSSRGYNTNTGRIYIFYNDGIYPAASASADVIINGETISDFFGYSLSAGDFNNDGKTDLAVGAYGYNSFTGRVYIFYNDGTYPTAAASADVIITGETTSNYFGHSLSSGDFNNDGKTDLAVGATGYNSTAGRVYIFYNDDTYPTASASADVVITGEAIFNYFGASLSAGDFNNDGKTDLAVGAYGYTSITGRTYIFYNDGTYPATAASADVIITGEATGNAFGISISSGDFNNDGKTDLAVGAHVYSSGTGRAYIFYNDGTYPTAAASADVIITGEAINNSFGISLSAGDFNNDGKTDLAVGASSYNSNTGRTYIFYNDGAYPTAAASADVVITGEATGGYFGRAFSIGDFNNDGKTDLVVGAMGYNSNTGRVYIYTLNDKSITGEAASNNFGTSLSAGDFNNDGKTDLAVGATGYNSTAGRVYIFYNDDTYPTASASADVVITGEAIFNNFGTSLSAGDFNNDGKTDLAVGASSYGTYTGRVYIFYNDGAYPTAAASADVIITGQATFNYFGSSLSAGDFNNDGKTDLAVSTNAHNSNTGRAYIFYNDGAYPTAAASADVIISGEATNNLFGSSLSAGDFNNDGKTDLAVGATGYNSDTGRTYIFYNDGAYPEAAASADVVITGETTGNYFGYSLSAGDFNNDGKTDLAVGASSYNSNTGRTYIFYNDGAYPTVAASADFTITGETVSNYFGQSLSAGDFNNDGKTDLAISSYGYNSGRGRTYIFYNDGAYPAVAAFADIIITGEATNNYFGSSLSSGDFNNDGKTDLAVGAYGYTSSTGRVYIYISELEKKDNIKGKIQGSGTFRGGIRFR